MIVPRILYIILLLSFSLIPPNLFGQTFKQIDLIIEQDDIDELESHPFTNEDVYGSFEVDGQTFDSVEIHYRGAYYLLTLINQGSLRNWKVKFSKENKFEGRREWNFNYENYIRQNLAYHVFRESGVPVVSSENVIFHVNGQLQGLYLKYEDPDDKAWLSATFGDNDGDLYKAAYDMPDSIKYFADLTYLGDNDEDYFLHYRKQTNKNGDDEFDYSSIREFTSLINHTPDNEFEQTILENFDVEEFIKYMVVANFIANWDSYPFRPKNYFLYDNPEDDKWHFIPWDLDGTFQADGFRNSIGTTGSIYHYFDGVDAYNATPTEPLERPLIWRLMENDLFRNKYCYEYKQAINSILTTDYLFGVIDSIAAGVADNTSGTELNKFNQDVVEVKSFITERLQNISPEISNCMVDTDPFTSIENLDKTQAALKLFPNPADNQLQIELAIPTNEKLVIEVINLLGQKLISSTVDWFPDMEFQLNIESLDEGQYFIMVRTDQYLLTEKFQKVE